jgi:hypothetical protein
MRRASLAILIPLAFAVACNSSDNPGGTAPHPQGTGGGLTGTGGNPGSGGSQGTGGNPGSGGGQGTGGKNASGGSQGTGGQAGSGGAQGSGGLGGSGGTTALAGSTGGGGTTASGGGAGSGGVAIDGGPGLDGGLDGAPACSVSSDLACKSDGDCCLIFNECWDHLLLVGKSQVDDAKACLDTKDKTWCTSCCPPVVETWCEAGQCVASIVRTGCGEAHCGRLSAQDAGAGNHDKTSPPMGAKVLSKPVIDAAANTGKTTFGCLDQP